MMKNIRDWRRNVSKNIEKTFFNFYSKLNFKFILKYILFVFFVFYLSFLFDIYGIFFEVKKVYLMPPRPIEELKSYVFSNIIIHYYGSLSLTQAIHILDKFKNLNINKNCFQLVDYDVINPTLKKIVQLDHRHPLRHPNINLLNLYENYIINFYGTTKNLNGFSLLTDEFSFSKNNKYKQYISDNLYVYDSCDIQVKLPIKNEYLEFQRDEFTIITSHLKNIQNKIIF